MKKLFSIAIVIMLGLVGTVPAASVSDLKLSYENHTTVATIVIDGQVRFTHETVEAKDGKPFRIVVDVLSAAHALPQKEFLALPKCAVSSIRTSQYSVTPERVVRLVFDMAVETVYRVDSDAHTIKLYFPNKKTGAFTSWTARKVKSPAVKQPPKVAASNAPAKTEQKTFASINKSIETDRQVSLQSTPPAAKETKKETTEPKTVATITAPTINKSSVKKASRIEIPNGPEFVATSPFEIVSDPPQKEQKESVIESDKAQPAAKLASIDQKVTQKSTQPVSKTETSTKEKLSSTASEPSKPKVKSAVEKKADQLASVGSSSHTGVTWTSVDKADRTDAKVRPTTVVSNKPKPSVTAEKKSKVKSESKVESKKLVSVPAKKASPVVKKSISKPVTKKQTASINKAAAKKSTQKSLASVPAKSSKANTKIAKKATSQKQSEKKVTKSVATKKATSRFRRSSSGSANIKGTLVAQFPKRLVIKYKGRVRDPFETLINETRIDNNPVERRAPNVEGLKLVGIIEAESGENRALFEDKNNFGYILKGGDKVQKGYVLRVEDDRVYFQIFEYGWSRTVALNIEGN